MDPLSYKADIYKCYIFRIGVVFDKQEVYQILLKSPEFKGVLF